MARALPRLLVLLVGLIACDSTPAGSHAAGPTPPSAEPTPEPESPPAPARPTAGLPEDALEVGRAYFESADARRELLEAALATADNGYARRRLERYTSSDWGARPEWNPPSRGVVADDLTGSIPPPDPGWTSLRFDGAWTHDALVDFGRRAFFTYPADLEPALRHALGSDDGPERYGLWRDGESVGGIRWTVVPDGVAPAMSCATCHTGRDPDGHLVPGLANADFDLGRLLDDFYGRRSAASRWGPGRLDATSGGTAPAAAIPDLRPVRYQHHLQRTALLENSLGALAVRIETSIIENHGGAVRPPREVAFAIAYYLWSLGEALPSPPLAGEGRALFDENCARCHVPPRLSGPPIPLAIIGTDPVLGASEDRGTGRYQTPSLRGVSQRRWLFATGAVEGLDELLDVERVASGHRYGLELSEPQRAALRAFLYSL